MFLTWAAVAVSGPALLFHAAAVTHHMQQNRAVPAAEKITGGGYARTAGWRAVIALAYLTVAACQAAGVRPGGGLSAESLIIFTVTQVTGLVNSGLDIPLRDRAARASRGPHAGGG